MVEIVAFLIYDPANNAVIDRHTDERTEDLGEEDGSRRNMHVVAKLTGKLAQGTEVA